MSDLLRFDRRNSKAFAAVVAAVGNNPDYVDVVRLRPRGKKRNERTNFRDLQFYSYAPGVEDRLRAAGIQFKTKWHQCEGGPRVRINIENDEIVG